MEDFEKGRASVAAHVRNPIELDASQTLDCRRLYNFFVVAFEIVHIPELTGLTDAFATGEPSLAIEL